MCIIPLVGDEPYKDDLIKKAEESFRKLNDRITRKKQEMKAERAFLLKKRFESES